MPRPLTALISCSPVPKPTHANHLIVLETGPEVVTGSTRMKAGTATKLALGQGFPAAPPASVSRLPADTAFGLLLDVSRGFSAAVSVVRSMPSRFATGPIGGGFGRFSDIRRENC